MKGEIRYLTSSAIDKKKWDSCIAEAKNGLVFAYSWYLDTLCDAWDGIVLNDYEVVFPITRKSKWGIGYFFNPIFALQLGVFSKTEISQELFQALLAKIPSNIRLINISLNFGNEFYHKGYTTTLRTCQFIDLHSTLEEIQAKYSTNLRRNLAKARKNNLEIHSSENIQVVLQLFRENRGETLKEITEDHYSRLLRLMSKLQNEKKAMILECRKGEEVLAAACFSVCNRRIIYIKGGTTKEGRDLGAMHLLMDNLIANHAGKDLTFDFGGSSIEQVARFNHGFGSLDYQYPQLYKNKLPFLLRLLKK